MRPAAVATHAVRLAVVADDALAVVVAVQGCAERVCVKRHSVKCEVTDSKLFMFVVLTFAVGSSVARWALAVALHARTTVLTRANLATLIQNQADVGVLHRGVALVALALA